MVFLRPLHNFASSRENVRRLQMFTQMRKGVKKSAKNTLLILFSDGILLGLLMLLLTIR